MFDAVSELTPKCKVNRYSEISQKRAKNMCQNGKKAGQKVEKAGGNAPRDHGEPLAIADFRN